MTIAIAIRAGSSVVFAADSKLTTVRIVGLEEDGSPRLVDQTYDNATKVVHDRSRSLMAMVAGHANIGQEAATDFVSRRQLQVTGSVGDQDRAIADIVAQMVDQKRAYWAGTRVPPERWPGPTLLLAASSPDGKTPRVWRVTLDGPDFGISEVLKSPGIRLEGSYDEVFSLLYGFDWNQLNRICEKLGVEGERLKETIEKLDVLAPIDKINFWSMPIQDAIEMAVFLANVQVEMDRFLPGTPACGGPIDVMVLHTAPEPGILSYPGKVLHHPAHR